MATVRALLRGAEGRRASRRLALELATERNRLRAILRQLPIGMLVVGAAAEVVMANTEAAEILGRDAIVTGMPDPFREQRLIRIDGGAAEPRSLPITRALAGAEVFGAEYLVVRPDGSQAHLRANAAPIREEDGSVSGAILTFLDITDRARTDLALRLLADLAEPLAAVGDLRRDLPAAARLLCPAFADRGGVALRTADGEDVEWLGETPGALVGDRRERARRARAPGGADRRRGVPHRRARAAPRPTRRRPPGRGGPRPARS